jgi:pimeloyl-ACP methyl ester carboxylesterase
MPILQRPDGAEIAWHDLGEGPPVVLANIGYADPAIVAGLSEELARDHRVLTYDTRGTGGSSRGGPYEVATDAGDLLAVVEDAGAAATVAVGNGDGANRAVRAAAERPDLIETVVIPGSLTLPAATSGAEGLSTSGSVLEGLLMLLENDYRAGVHAFVSTGNPGLGEDLIQKRVELIVAYCSQEAALDRIRSWIADDPTADAQALGDRLWLLHHEANPWFANTSGARTLLPDAHHEEVADGPMARPDLTAAVVRELTRTAAR